MESALLALSSTTMGAVESRSLHLFCKVVFLDEGEEIKERLVHEDVDLILAYCTRQESLEHLCFRVEEWIWDYAINMSFKPEDDHPDNTTFAIGIKKCFVPPPQDEWAGKPAVAMEMGHHWEEHQSSDDNQLGSLLTHPHEQEICFTGVWFAATYLLQGAVLCCGPPLRRLPPHDGFVVDCEDGAEQQEGDTGSSEAVADSAAEGVASIEKQPIPPSSTSLPSMARKSSMRRVQPDDCASLTVTRTVSMQN